MEYTYEYDIWGGVKSCTPVVEEKKEALKKKGSKKEAPISDKEKE